jgi:DNA-nicking Smr family endonuclease
MPPRRRGLTEADQALWANYTRQVAPLLGKPQRPATLPEPGPSVPLAKPARRVRKPTNVVSDTSNTPPDDIAAWLLARGAPVKRHRSSTLAVGDQPSGLDKSTWNRFRTGKLEVARTLDLHGMTAQRAHTALTAFLRAAHADQVRVVEVVTGRGSGETGGVIRRELPLWLNLPDIRPMILGASHPHPQNPGSVRLILRRIR